MITRYQQKKGMMIYVWSPHARTRKFGTANTPYFQPQMRMRAILPIINIQGCLAKSLDKTVFIKKMLRGSKRQQERFN